MFSSSSSSSSARLYLPLSPADAWPVEARRTVYCPLIVRLGLLPCSRQSWPSYFCCHKAGIKVIRPSTVRSRGQACRRTAVRCYWSRLYLQSCGRWRYKAVEMLQRPEVTGRKREGQEDALSSPMLVRRDLTLFGLMLSPCAYLVGRWIASEARVWSA